MNKIKMWRVGVISIDTHEKIEVIVPAKSNEHATKLVSKLYPWGYNDPYKWVGTGPAYSNNKRLTMEIDI